MDKNRRVTKLIAWIGLILVLGVFAVDFHLDICDRDSFSWLDPYQYYQFAVDFVRGDRAYNEFELPSIFPFMMYPVVKFSNSIPAALWTNILFAAILAVAVTLLCREVKLSIPPFLVLLVILCCPLITGLSRELYLEFSLCAIVALAFGLWFKSDGFTRGGYGILFAVIFTIGLMMKMTFPLFFIGPLIGEFVLLACDKKRRQMIRLTAAVAGAAAAVILIELLFFPVSIQYYRTLGNTLFPIMKLLGPPRIFSADSITFYAVHLYKTMLMMLVPFLALPLLKIGTLTQCRHDEAARKDLVLWLWFLVPLVLLIFQPVKEPRHVAPCLIPAVLLIFRGLEQIKTKKHRIVLTGILIAVSLLQYAAITSHRVYCPYFLDTPVHIKQIERALAESDPLIKEQGISTDDFLARPLLQRSWKYTRNFVIDGFGPNTALALMYHLFPGVVYDMNLVNSSSGNRSDLPFRIFYDLNMLTSFNSYNHRCRWGGFYHTLDKAQILQNADLIIMNTAHSTIKPDSISQAAAVTGDLPGFSSAATVQGRDGPIVIFTNDTPSTTGYRQLYASKFLKRNTSLDYRELNTILFELFMTTTFRNGYGKYDSLLEDFPEGYVPGQEKRWIYWDAVYRDLYRPVQSMYDAYINSKRLNVKR